MLKAYLLLLSGYIGWGLFPLYWSLLAHIPPLEVTLHRAIWSVPVLLLLVYVSQNRRTAFHQAVRDSRSWKRLALTATLITINWGVYVWAVANHRVVEASMGYFLTPLLNVLGGVFIFKEPLQRLQWLAVVCAAVGVAYYISTVSVFPWVGLTVGFSFSAYGILRKQASISAVPGLLFETLLIAPFALATIAWLSFQKQSHFQSSDIDLDVLWLILGGVVTVTPLALFTAGTRLLPMTTVGIMFYITPSMQFVMGYLLFKEPISQNMLVGFTGIWLGLGFYTWTLLSPKSTKLPKQAA